MKKDNSNMFMMMKSLQKSRLKPKFCKVNFKNFKRIKRPYPTYSNNKTKEFSLSQWHLSSGKSFKEQKINSKKLRNSAKFFKLKLYKTKDFSRKNMKKLSAIMQKSRKFKESSNKRKRRKARLIRSLPFKWWLKSNSKFLNWSLKKWWAKKHGLQK